MSHGVQVEETALPGIGVRQELVTTSGRRVGVVSYRTGRRELVLYDTEDPDSCSAVIPLRDDEADALAEVLGAPRIVERLAKLHEQAAGLVTEKVPITPGSPYDGLSMGETRARTRTGASIVAVLRHGEVVTSPGPSFRFEANDTVVVVGTRDGTADVAEIIANG